LPIKTAWMFIPAKPLGLRDKAFQGESFFTAPNPPFGAVFTYCLKDELKTKKKARLAAEKKVASKGGDVFYPSWEALRAEEVEEEPAILLTVNDAAGNVVRRLTGPVKSGFHRMAWDLRYPAPNPPAPPRAGSDEEEDQFRQGPRGPLAMPGMYKVSLAKKADGTITPLGEPAEFSAEILGAASLPSPDRAKVLEFEQKTARLQRAVLGSVEVAKEAQKRLDGLKKVLLDTPAASPVLLSRTRELELRLKDLQTSLSGDRVLAKHQEPVPPSIVERVQSVVHGHWSTTSAPTGTHLRSYEVAAQEFAPVLEKLKVLIETDLKDLETKAEAAGAPWTPGRVPNWRAD
jgi:hypothetical protein